MMLCRRPNVAGPRGNRWKRRSAQPNPASTVVGPVDARGIDRAQGDLRESP